MFKTAVTKNNNYQNHSLDVVFVLWIRYTKTETFQEPPKKDSSLWNHFM